MTIIQTSQNLYQLNTDNLPSLHLIVHLIMFNNQMYAHLIKDVILSFIEKQCLDDIFSHYHIATPINLPLVIEVEGVELSPYFQVGQGQHLDIEFYDFTLENIEEEHENSNDQNQVSQEQNQSDHNLQNQSEEQLQKQIIDNHNHQPTVAIPEILPSKLNIYYFKDVYSQLKKGKASEAQIREFLSDYLTDQNLEQIEFDQCPIEYLEKMAKENLRYVGPISWLERKYKVSKYIEKKKNRIWKKKISYDCRKRVADNRLRVKGKFVTKSQACNMLGVEQLEEQDLKQLLESRKSQSHTR